jgi:hypothetical protein
MLFFEFEFSPVGSLIVDDNPDHSLNLKPYLLVPIVDSVSLDQAKVNVNRLDIFSIQVVE